MTFFTVASRILTVIDVGGDVVALGWSKRCALSILISKSGGSFSPLGSMSFTKAGAFPSGIWKIHVLFWSLSRRCELFVLLEKIPLTHGDARTPCLSLCSLC